MARLPSLLVVVSLVSVLVLLTKSPAAGKTGSRRHPQLLVVSFDGFRWDYLDAYDPPNFRSVAAKGVKAVSGMIPAFPTYTFPDHHTMVTGLHPESHGIVDNVMYDSAFNENFTYEITADSKWWNYGDTEPIWITARKQNLKSATYFWPGSEVNFSGVMANHWASYNETVPFHESVDTAVGCLNDSIDLVILYFGQPDLVGHKYGAFSDKLKGSVTIMDETMGYLLKQLEDIGLKDKINMIVTSDHGMTNVSLDEKDVIYLQDVLAPTDYKLISQTGPQSSILPQDGAEDRVFEKLKHAHPNITVYRKKDIPDRFHYRNNRRILPIMVMADEGYTILLNRSEFENASIGQHGFDNRLPSMRPFFLASGPSFKQNAKIDEPFDSIHVYPLMCHLLGIEPRPNNGSLAVLEPYLVKDKSPSSSASALFAISSASLYFTILMPLLLTAHRSLSALN